MRAEFRPWKAAQVDAMLLLTPYAKTAASYWGWPHALRARDLDQPSEVGGFHVLT